MLVDVAFMIVAFMAVTVTFMIVAVFEAQVRRIGRFRLGVVLDGVGRTQGFAFQAQSAESTAKVGCILSVSGCKFAVQGFKNAPSCCRQMPPLPATGHTGAVRPGSALVPW